MYLRFRKSLYIQFDSAFTDAPGKTLPPFRKYWIIASPQEYTWGPWQSPFGQTGREVAINMLDLPACVGIKPQ